MKTIWNHYSYAIVLIILSFAIAFIISIRFDTFHHNQYETVTVSEGDSLWKIADNYSEEQSLSKVDFVNWVKTHNQIDEDHIYPGEKIVIPVSSKQETSNEFASAAKE
jgi:cell division protein YceG involved in septum cleavage